MSIVRVYKSTDPGAPAHPSATRGSMAALLRACLVSGYGNGDAYKGPAGWEEPYSEVNGYACFRALQGTARLFYQIDDATTNTAVARATMFDSMSDVSAGYGNRGSVFFGKWYDPATAFTWVVLADETTCYVALRGRYHYILHGFGEYQSLIDDDPCPAFISGHNDNTRLGHNRSDWPLMYASVIDGTTPMSGFIRRSITSELSSRFSVLAIGQAVGPITADNKFSSFLTPGVSAVFLPCIIKALDDTLNGLRQPIGILRGMKWLLGKDDNATPGLLTLACEGPGVAAGVSFDITGAW